MPRDGLFLLLEHLTGPTLQQVAPISSDQQRSDWMDQLENTVIRLHEMGIAHRDLSTRNVIAASDRQVKLIDFAFSKTIENFRSEKNEDLQALARIRSELRI